MGGGPGGRSPLRVAAGARKKCDRCLQQAWQGIQRTEYSRGRGIETASCALPNGVQDKASGWLEQPGTVT